jgi:CRP/FNR family transcriptional regulator, cyclic AMP receptor protein
MQRSLAFTASLESSLVMTSTGATAPSDSGSSISQETLAEMIGATRSRVSHFMNKFRKLGLIDYNGHIEVHNSLLSAVLHDKPQLRGHE